METYKFKLEDLQDSENINELLSEEQSNDIGRKVCQGYEIDDQSRSTWKSKMKDATDLALQLVKQKASPWRNASNVKFPLLTIASLQFSSRAYPALVKAPDLVKYRVQGKDPEGIKAARAQRISSHMSYQCLDEDEGWEPDHDKLLLALPILGTVFKKTYYDSVKGHNCSRLVLPKNLCVNYYARSLEECGRKTEIFELYENEIKERQLRKVYSDVELSPAEVEDKTDADERQGTTPPLDDNYRPRKILEQHCYMDFDGDGYKEPYVITVDKSTQKVLRIVNRFGEIVTEQSLKIKDLQSRQRALAEGLAQPGEEITQEQIMQAMQVEQTIMAMNQQVEKLAQEKPKVLKITPIEYYTKYSFIPAPDGGFYDIGFGVLLGHLNESVNTLINQLIDAGTLQNGSMGFIGKGARIKGGELNFRPNEWKRIDVAGPTLKDAIVPLPVNEPSAVLFNLLGMLISYTERVSSVNDTMMGENPGQNTPAYNMSAMLEQGMQVFNGIFKRVYRSMRSEFRKQFALNAIYLDEQMYFEYQDEEGTAVRVDYTADSKDLIPAADPNAFSNKEKVLKSQLLAERAMMVPGYDPIVVEKRFLEAMDIPNSAEVYPLVSQLDPETGEDTGTLTWKFPPQPDPELEIKKADMQRRTLEGKARAEKDFLLASAQMAVSEASVIKTLAEAKKVAEEPEIKRIELLLNEIQDQRKALVEMAKIEDKVKERADKRLERKSSNS